MTDSLPRKGERTREKLIRAAAQVFSEKGFHDAKVEDIAARAEVAKGTVYLHFTSKEQVALMCVEKLEGLLKQWADAQPSSQALGEMLSTSEFERGARLVLRSFFELYAAERWLFHFSMGLAAAPRIREPLSKYLDRLFQTGKNIGVLRSSVPSQSMALFASGAAFQAAHECLYRSGRPVDAELVAHFTRFVLEGARFRDT